MSKVAHLSKNDHIDSLCLLFSNSNSAPSQKESALWEIVESTFKLVVSSIGKENLSQIYIKSNLDDIAMDAREFVIEHVKSYKPLAGSHFTGYLVNRANLSFFPLVRGRYGSTGSIDKNWHKVKAAIYASRDQFYLSFKRYPTKDELLSLVEASFVERYLNGPPTKANIISAKNRLKKDGIAKALSDFDAILASINVDISFDSVDNDALESTYASLRSQVEHAQSFTTELEHIYYLALGDKQWALPSFIGYFGALAKVEGSAIANCEPNDILSLNKLADQVDVNKNDLKRILVNAKSRITAPHAQYCYLPETFLFTQSTISKVADSIYGAEDLGF